MLGRIVCCCVVVGRKRAGTVAAGARGDCETKGEIGRDHFQPGPGVARIPTQQPEYLLNEGNAPGPRYSARHATLPATLLWLTKLLEPASLFGPDTLLSPPRY
jgi:hypothetical protein